ncbi:hypothetical protein [Nostoc sp. FACHB-892]|nr:hypothetical protein [Nostoc sp. FACHB-892]
MSSDKQLRVYALFLRFSVMRSHTLAQQVIALFLRFSVRRSLF